MKDYRNYVPIIITACNIAVAVLFTWTEATGSFPDSIEPYKGLFILYYFMSWIITLILITILTIILVKNISERRVEIFPFPVLILNIGYLIYIFRLFYLGE